MTKLSLTTSATAEENNRLVQEYVKKKNKEYDKAKTLRVIGKPSKKKRGLMNKASSSALVPVPIKVPTAFAQKPTMKPELSDDALHGLFAEIVSTAVKHCEACKAALLFQALLRFAVLIPDHFIWNGEVQHWARTYAVIVGNSSKSVINASVKTIDRLFDGFRTPYRYFSGPLSKVDDIINKVRDGSEENNHAGRYVKADHGESSKSLCVRDKNFAISLASKKPALDIMSSTYTGLFDSGEASVQITKDKVLKTTGSHISIIANIQRTALDSLRDQLNIPNGFASLFLWPLAYRQGCLPLSEPIPKEDVERINKLIAQRAEEAKMLSGPITMTDKALKLWNKSHPGLTTQYSGFAGSVVDRNDDHALRLAVIYALGAGHSQIQTQDLKAAIAVVNYSCESALLLFNGANQDKRQEKIKQALRSAPNQELASTEITKLFGNKISANEKDEILHELVAAKIVVMEKVEGKTKGKKTMMVKLVAAEHQQS